VLLVPERSKGRFETEVYPGLAAWEFCGRFVASHINLLLMSSKIKYAGEIQYFLVHVLYMKVDSPIMLRKCNHE
jgi:hypothetical protein